VDEIERIELWLAHPDLDTADVRRFAVALRVPLAYRAAERVAYVAPILRPVGGPYTHEARLMDFAPANAVPGPYGDPARRVTAHLRFPSAAWAAQACERFVLTGEGMPPAVVHKGEDLAPGCARVGLACDAGGCPCE